MPDNVRYRPQTVNYVGFLQTQLRDLQGIATLAYELIQNADDVLDDQGHPAASRITFDICDDALIIENDGVFREVDFDRISNIASGGKREEQGTTGAFGIGFISVYQVTDRPEIFSSGQHWRIRPDKVDVNQRIEIRDVDTKGTKFHLPWAFDPQSEVRRKLRIEAVNGKQFDSFQEEIGQAISLAVLFLKQLTILELKRSGRFIKRIERLPVEDDQVLIEDGGPTLAWRIFRGNFDSEATQLRLKHHLQIEEKRRSNVLIAIPDEPLTSGRLFAVLPTETIVPLPFHINADFFPSNDRKHIIFGADYQSEWNRAAVRAAARTLVTHFDKLRDLLRHKGIWQVLQRFDDCRRQVEQYEYDPVFATFWEEIAPTLPVRPIVYTSTGEWITPGKARLLESGTEEAASSILESLNIPIVHPDLRPYFGLLRQKEIGTPLLKVADIIEVLMTAGLNKRTELNQAPLSLRTAQRWQMLWQVFDTLLERRQQAVDEKVQAKNMLSECAIAFGMDGALWPPAQLFWADAGTKALFTEIQWLADTHEPEKVPHSLVKEFTATHAINFLAHKSKEQLENEWRNHRLDLVNLYQWFEHRKSEILPNWPLKQKLSNLPIWPTSGQLGSLVGLYIPGGFDDPLKLSGLIDIEALGGRREFLKDLGVQELTFETYVRVQVPQVFQGDSDLSSDARRQLVQLLAKRLGEIRDDQALQERLGRLPLIECTDDIFRSANQVYIHPNIETILGSHIHVAKSIKQNADAVKALYEWLGVAQQPRATDVINRIRDLVAQSPHQSAYQIIEVVFEYLAEQWSKWEQSEQNRYNSLRQMAWLPSHKDSNRWYHPHELYAIFQSYLFETQAHFLNISRQFQNRAGTTGLIEFLNIKTTPSPTLVVRHLKEYSQQNKPVNKEVYRFLNDNTNDPILAELHGTACLLLSTNQYVRPDQVFWNEHPFGSYRHQLGSELRPYHGLFTQLGVRERPQDQDYLQVLLEISERYNQSHSPLDEQSLAIVMRCWEELSVALDQERLTIKDFISLKEHPVVPNVQHMLTEPENIFFEDRAGLAAKFPLFLENNVIVRPQGAWRAMEKVGVRLLSDAIELHIIENEDVIDDDRLATRVQERRLLLDRVIESEKASGSDELNSAILDELHFQRARKLLVNYSLQAFNQKRTTEPEVVPALFLREDPSLIVIYENDHVSWSAIARELASAIKQIGEIGGLAGGIKEVLASISWEEASRSLDELGYPPLQKQAETEVKSTDPIDDLGGDDLTPEEAVSSILGDLVGIGRAEMPETPPETPPVPKGIPGKYTEPGTGDGTGHTPGTGGEPGRKTSQKRKPTGMLRTYVTHNGDGDSHESDPDAQRRRTRVGQAGVDRVLSYEAERGRNAVDTNKKYPNHPGYDVESIDDDGTIRYIEVKAMEGYWGRRTPAAVTKTQFDKARELGDQFWLYVVEFATDDERYYVYPIPNPAGSVNQYLFDDGWQELAEIEEIEIRTPNV